MDRTNLRARLASLSSTTAGVERYLVGWILNTTRDNVQREVLDVVGGGERKDWAG